MAVAAAIAAQDIYEREGLFARARSLSGKFEDCAHALRDAPHVRDIRNLGLVAGIELEPRPQRPGTRAYEVFLRCLERGVLIRYTGDTLALSPPLIVEPAQIEQIFGTVAEALRSIG
jgi:beta-alanine--pyruvate transaminase